MQDSIVLGFLGNTPPITRLLVVTITLTSLLVYIGIIYPHQLTYSRYYLPKLQLHRIITSFLYFGQINFELLMHIFFFYRYSSMLEESCNRTSDYFYILLVISGILFFLSNIYYIPLLGPSLSSTVTYIWTRRNPQAIVQIMGFVSFYAFYLPFIVPMFTLVFEGRISVDDLVGILVGHLVFYFKDVYPRIGADFLATPCWCHRLFKEHCEKCQLRRPRTSLREARKKVVPVMEEAVEQIEETEDSESEEEPESEEVVWEQIGDGDVPADEEGLWESE